MLTILLPNHKRALSRQIPIIILNTASLITLHTGKRMKIQQRRFALTFPERILSRCGHIDGEMITGLAWVLGTDVTFAVETVVLETDA